MNTCHKQLPGAVSLSASRLTLTDAAESQVRRGMSVRINSEKIRDREMIWSDEICYDGANVADGNVSVFA